MLLPRVYWLSKDDDKFHRVMLDIPVVGASTLTLGPVDQELEPRRENFMRHTCPMGERILQCPGRSVRSKQGRITWFLTGRSLQSAMRKSSRDFDQEFYPGTVTYKLRPRHHRSTATQQEAMVIGSFLRPQYGETRAICWSNQKGSLQQVEWPV